MVLVAISSADQRSASVRLKTITPSSAYIAYANRPRFSAMATKMSAMVTTNQRMRLSLARGGGWAAAFEQRHLHVVQNIGQDFGDAHVLQPGLRPEDDAVAEDRGHNALHVIRLDEVAATNGG